MEGQKIVGLDGRVRDPTQPLRDEEVAELLADAFRRNQEGRIRGALIVTIDEEGLCSKAFASDRGWPPTVVIGALEILKAYCIRKLSDEPSTSEPWHELPEGA